MRRRLVHKLGLGKRSSNEGQGFGRSVKGVGALKALGVRRLSTLLENQLCNRARLLQAAEKLVYLKGTAFRPYITVV
jgi:hypothetical protein